MRIIRNIIFNCRRQTSQKLITTTKAGRQTAASPAVAAKMPALMGSIVAVSVAALICLPLLAVVWLAFSPTENIWPHLLSTVLPDYVLTTALLMMGVAIGTTIIGVTTAWCVTSLDFTGRSLFVWALLLPFAVPAYVIAYVYTDLLEFAGPVQTALRAMFGWQSARDYSFPSIRTLGGAMVMMVLVLYPYVYLLARAAFTEQSTSLIEAARALGQSRTKSFFAVSLPLARPAIAVGVAMALMETLNDYGTVDYFSVRTLTAGIYDVWLGMGNLGGGAQIACLLLIFVLVILWIERSSRRRQQQFQPSSSRFKPVDRLRLHGWKNVLAFTVCALPVLLGFIIPCAVLALYAIKNFAISWNADFRQIALNSVMLSTCAASITVFLGIFLAYSMRIAPNRVLKWCTRFASTSYAVPGAVLAIGVMVTFTRFDNAVDAFARSQFNYSTGLLLSGTVTAIIFAYVVRFIAVAYGSIESSLCKITPSMDMAARSLGNTPTKMLWKVHIPMMRSGIITAALVVFVDCMKELPATLVLRPFNFDTLATHVYQFASDELIEQSALGALFIVLTGLIPIMLLSFSIDRSRTLTHK